jgi:DNA (cytosine-5)-methyltransferase 1
MTNSPIISLFTGAGGLDLGAIAEGGRVAVCVENDRDCQATLRQNHLLGEAPILEDITTLTGEELLAAGKLAKGSVALLIGGPPCQPFSKAGYWTSTGEEARRRQGANTTSLDAQQGRGKPRLVEADPRSNLVGEYARVLEETRPAGFVFENVTSITHPSSKPVFERFLSECSELGYSTTVVHANAAEYGVPQLRKRVFVLGLHGAHAPSAPVTTHSLPKTANSSAELTPAVGAGQAIAPFEGSEFAEDEEVVEGRYSAHLKEIPPGWNYKALTAWAGYPNPPFVAERRFWNFLLKLHPDQPSWTIAANPGPWVGPFHWDSRRLRLPELAALQSFPTGFKFAGSRRSAHRQIGNAVPPRMAAAMVGAVLAEIEGRT